MTTALPFADLALARRLERAEARGNADFVEARAHVFPDSGAGWIEVAGAYAMFDGVASPITQTFGLGLFDPVGQAEFECIEQFFQARGAITFHEISPLADTALLPLLHARGYRPIEFTTVMWRPLDPRVSTTASTGVRVRVIDQHEYDLWALTAASGWSESPEAANFMRTFAQVNAYRRESVSFIAEREGQPIATGALSVSGGVALLAGASTVPHARNQGAQRALLDSRLQYAREHGCDIAMMCALPGSASQRNAEREGFRIAYTRLKWQLAATPG